MQTVYDAAFAVEARADYLEERRIARLVMPKDGIGNKVGELNQARGFRIKEKWNFSEVADNAPRVTDGAEVGGKRLVLLYLDLLNIS